MNSKLMKMIKSLAPIIAVLICLPLEAQTNWPLEMSYENMNIQIFKPETESFNTNQMSLRAALMITEDGNNVFGSLWADANLQINQSNRTVSISSATVTDLRFPDGYAVSRESGLNSAIGRSLRGVTIKMDDILADLETEQQEETLNKSMNNTAPKVYYSATPAILVTIDGDPIFQATETSGVEMLVNSPFLILKYKNVYYLSNSSLWYESRSPLAGWTPKLTVAPSAVVQTAEALKSDDDPVATERSFYPEVIVSTVPAELIQTDGSPTFAAIPNTMMLYVTNTSDQIVMDIRSQRYFVLLSGRWYASTKLDGAWSYIDTKNLPADFANIPEGSDKDILLASVPNTQASTDAVRESQVPQAAVIDRSTTTTTVVYDGDPQFENIEGTGMRYAVNSSGTVIQESNNYYVVDNGVWFIGAGPRGPWVVSERRPTRVHLIPPSCPVYNTRYVHIYHSTPRYVYVGYTRGYLSSYVVGGVVVYGTGHRYTPWRGRYYYPRPCTWGFGMSYNPWHGWSVNFIYGTGWFGYSYPHSYYSYYPYYSYRPTYHYRSGWWGPPVYRPPYCVPYSHYYGASQAQVRNQSRYVIPNNVRTSTSASRSSSMSSSRSSSNIYSYNNSRSGVQPARSSAALRSSESGRQTLTRSYSAQARPSATATRTSSQTATTRPASTTASRNNSTSRAQETTTASRSSSATTTSDQRTPTTSGTGSTTRSATSSATRSNSTTPATSTTSTTSRSSATTSTSSTKPATSTSGTRNPTSASGTTRSSSSTAPSTSSSATGTSTRTTETQPSRSSNSQPSSATTSNNSSSTTRQSATRSNSTPATTSTSSTKSASSSSSSSSRSSSGNSSGSNSRTRSR
jgi:hypothetical protein